MSLQSGSVDRLLNHGLKEDDVFSIISFGRYIRHGEQSSDLSRPPSSDWLGVPLISSESFDKFGHWIDDSVFDVQLSDNETSLIIPFSPNLNHLFFSHALTPNSIISITATEFIGPTLMISDVSIISTTSPPLLTTRFFPSWLCSSVSLVSRPLIDLHSFSPILSPFKFFLPLHDNSIVLPSNCDLFSSPLYAFSDFSGPSPVSISEFIEKGLSRKPFIACITECGALSHKASSFLSSPGLGQFFDEYPFEFIVTVSDSQSNFHCFVHSFLAFSLWNHLKPGMFVLFENVVIQYGDTEIHLYPHAKYSPKLFELAPLDVLNFKHLQVFPKPPQFVDFASLPRVRPKKLINIFGILTHVSPVFVRKVTRGDFQQFRIINVTNDFLTLPIFIALASNPSVFYSLESGQSILITSVSIVSSTPSSLANQRSILGHFSNFSSIVRPTDDHPFSKFSFFSTIPPLHSSFLSLCFFPPFLRGCAELFSVLRIMSVSELHQTCKKMSKNEALFVVVSGLIVHQFTNSVQLVSPDLSVSCLAQVSNFSIFRYKNCLGPLSGLNLTDSFENLATGLESISGQRVVSLVWLEQVESFVSIVVIGVYPYTEGYESFRSRE
ncbi:hypothetical protein RCL1_007821 [Eukaryota sp. TZLM3-RCL]